MGESATAGGSTERASWAMVTGSTSGIGRETALRLAADGYSIVVCGRDRGRAADTRRLIESAGGRAVDLVADFGIPAAVRGLVAETKEILGGDASGDALDVLVNCAGGGGFAPTEDTTEEMFDTAFNLNVKAPYILTGAFAPAMARRGRGAIVNVGSLSTTMAAAGTSAFQAAKAALSMLTKSWTAEYGPRGVRVNSVDPGYILTPVNEHMRDMYGGYLAGLPAARGGEPEEVAEATSLIAPLSQSEFCPLCWARPKTKSPLEAKGVVSVAVPCAMSLTYRFPFWAGPAGTDGVAAAFPAAVAEFCG